MIIQLILNVKEIVLSYILAPIEYYDSFLKISFISEFGLDKFHIIMHGDIKYV